MLVWSSVPCRTFVIRFGDSLRGVAFGSELNGAVRCTYMTAWRSESGPRFAQTAVPVGHDMRDSAFSPDHPSLAAQAVRVPVGPPAALFVVVDTEEEFDWNCPFARQNTSVNAIRQLPVLQALLDRYSVRPTYVIDYPVATSPISAPIIRDLYASGRCTVGAHLHPWVNPPFDEPLTPANSFAFNLGYDLERAKLEALTDAVEQHVGTRPRIYKAGRYGFGPSTVRVLEELDYVIDVSVNPYMDYSNQRGPNFELFDARPFWFGSTGALLEVPCTLGFAGVLRRYGRRIHRLVDTPTWRAVRLPGILSRSGALNKIMLSPETSTLTEMRAVTRALMEDGVRTFSLTLHSPSVEPGHTPYVRSSADLRAFLDRIAAYCEFFFGELAGVPATLDEFRQLHVAGGAAA